ncbi:uncharacterized protein LOC128855090 [Anastrepha ludens]|uniref:uncharacterized protein LOC128855090 n=1 Tax=Anastrepha ludens TaxID=28586 RepID=UPI0023AF89AD|nr:uncharacterized protein LOC128855090 [Anastrepha ludens]
MDEVDVMTRLLRKLSAANVSPEERQRLQAQIEEIMRQESDPFETSGNLFPYRGRTRFSQYIPSKPAKYGMKVWWVCDSVSNYPLKGIIYTGKPPGGQRETNQGEPVVMKLMENYMDSELLNPKRDVKSTLFCYHNINIALCSYMAKPKKPAIMLSTAHCRQSTDPLKGFKPDQILDYNKIKAGVDTMDQMLTSYS